MNKNEIVDNTVNKSNCIPLKQGETSPRDGILYTVERHEALETYLAELPAQIKESIKEVMGHEPVNAQSSGANSFFKAGKVETSKIGGGAQ